MVMKIRTVNDVTTYYAYKGDKVVMEVTEGAVIRNLYAGKKLVMRDMVALEESYYYYYNGHGDVTALSDISKNAVLAEYDYDPFGNITTITNEELDNPIMYAGYQYDDETGLYYLNARMYDPEIARFMQMDTYTGQSSDPLSLNLYSYTHNNPVTYYDPTGHILSEWDKDNVTSSKDRIAIEKATAAWDSTSSQAEKDKAHADAEEIRNKYRMYHHLEYHRGVVGPAFLATTAIVDARRGFVATQTEDGQDHLVVDRCQPMDDPPARTRQTSSQLDRPARGVS